MPRLTRLLDTATFRLALAFAAVFAVGIFALLLVLQWSIKGYAGRQTDDALRSEMALVQDQAARTGTAAIARELAARSTVPGARAPLYVVGGPGGRVLGGNLPSRLLVRDGFDEVALPAPAENREFDDETMTVRTLAAGTPDGGRLALGRDTYALDELNEWLDQLTLWAGAGLALMALTGGLVSGALFLSRLEHVNSAAERIMRGRLDERLPAIGFGAEFDRLSGSLNRMLDRLQTSMESLKQVSADIAHDLRTPLGHLRQRLERARGEAASEADWRAVADAAIADIDEVLAVFGSLLRIAQLEAGTGRDQFQTLDFSTLLERVTDAFGPAAEDGGRVLTTEIEPGLMVRGDSILLGQLASNVIENALTHTPPGSTVTVGAGRQDGTIRLAVADDGPGVPVGELDRITRRFYRLDRSRATPGAGLGLSMAAAIAEAHATRLELTDNRPGLRVEVRFPAVTG